MFFVGHSGESIDEIFVLCGEGTAGVDRTVGSHCGEGDKDWGDVLANYGDKEFVFDFGGSPVRAELPDSLFEFFDCF